MIISSAAPDAAIGALREAQQPVIKSEIVIVDDDGNEEPYDPAKH
ncbi:hypothetical protein ACIRS1_02925 [Kitasatospora sp. NPDC101176]